MNRTREILTGALVAYLVLLPALVRPAEAQLTPRPFDPPDGGRAFEPRAATTTITGFNDFVAKATPGYLPHGAHHHDGGIGSFESPWGEKLDLRYWATADGLAIEFDGEVTLRYSFGPGGTLRELRAVTANREVRTRVGNRAELAARGQVDPVSFDMSAYELLNEVLRANHSEVFLEGMAQLEGPIEAACSIELARCSACIIRWALTLTAIALACNPGGVLTFGIACLVAIVAHELSNIECALTCVQAFQGCDHDPKGGRPSNCDGPG